MGKNIELENEKEGLVVNYTDYIKTEKGLTITVPKNYKVIAFIDEKVVFRIESCIKKDIVKSFGKDLIGKEIKYAFILKSSVPQLSWGFGNINVNNSRLKEAYRMGANGKYVVDIVDYAKLINQFTNKKEILVDDIREKTIPILKMKGIPILSSYFANTDVSVFEINSKMDEFRTKFVETLQSEDMLFDMGLKVKYITVDGLHVNDEDLELIRNRINKEEN